jgi:hypothetical protein
MDRRHLVLAIAVLAVVGDERDLPPVLEGEETLDAGLLAIEGQDSTTWIVKAAVELPPESRDVDVWSSLRVRIDLPASGAEPRFRIAARTCGSAGIHDEVTVPAEKDTGDTGKDDTGEQDTGAPAHYELTVGGLFEGCPAEELCERAVCIDASNEADTVLALAVEIDAYLSSDETVEYGSDETIEVPIALSIEEENGS